MLISPLPLQGNLFIPDSQLAWIDVIQSVPYQHHILSKHAMMYLLTILVGCGPHKPSHDPSPVSDERRQVLPGICKSRTLKSIDLSASKAPV